MKVGDQHYRTIWMEPHQKDRVFVIDQRHLPHQFVIEEITSTDQMATAIKDMHVRGAGLIGAAGGYGMYLATLEQQKGNFANDYLGQCAEKLNATRPTAIDLSWAVNRQLEALKELDSYEQKVKISLQTAHAIADENAQAGYQIGLHGTKLIEALSEQKNGEVVNILTHCNAGWMAFVDYGSATAPIYEAHKKGVKVHVWVDETRPRNQGARITAWELQQQGVPHTVIADNTGGHLMQKGMVDMVMVGSDRTTYTGDVANKIGTYLKALAAFDNKVPFYVTLPSSSIDWNIQDGQDIPIEQRDAEEVKYIRGLYDGQIRKVLLTPEESPAVNYAFDVTPARLVTGLITERGICKAHAKALFAMFPENRWSMD